MCRNQRTAHGVCLLLFVEVIYERALTPQGEPIHVAIELLVVSNLSQKWCGSDIPTRGDS